MPNYRAKWIKRLEPIADHLSEYAARLIRGKTNDELAQLAKDVKKPDHFNCPANVFQAKFLLDDAIWQEQTRRRLQAGYAGSATHITALVRVRADEKEAYANDFEHADGVDIEAAARAAIAEFLATPEGKKAYAETCEDFNWGDSIQYVPDDIWQRHGLRLLLDHEDIEAVYVNQDERFEPE